MQFITFLVVVTLISRFLALGWLNSLFYALGLMAYLYLGQIILAVVIGQTLKLFIRVERSEKRRADIGTKMMYVINFIVISIVSYLISPLLIISGLAGMIIFYLAVKTGKRQYQKYLNET